MHQKMLEAMKKTEKGNRRKGEKKVNEEKNTGVVLPCLLLLSHLPSSPQLHFLLFSCVGVETKTKKNSFFFKEFFNSISTKHILVLLCTLHLMFSKKKLNIKTASLMHLYHNYKSFKNKFQEIISWKKNNNYWRTLVVSSCWAPRWAPYL